MFSLRILRLRFLESSYSVLAIICFHCHFPCDNSLLRVCCSLVDLLWTRVYV
jgi:hypothetical protein